MANRDQDFGSEDMATQREIASRANISGDKKMPGHQFPPSPEEVEEFTGEKAHPVSEPENEEQRSKPDYNS